MTKKLIVRDNEFVGYRLKQNENNERILFDQTASSDIF